MEVEEEGIKKAEILLSDRNFDISSTKKSK